MHTHLNWYNMHTSVDKLEKKFCLVNSGFSCQFLTFISIWHIFFQIAIQAKFSINNSL